MNVITHRTFESESIALDDKRFVDCSLVDCILEYSGGEVTFERTRFSGCSFVFTGAAHSTLRILRLLQLDPLDVTLQQEHPMAIH